MSEQAPRIDLSNGGGRLVYDKSRRTIVSTPKETTMNDEPMLQFFAYSHLPEHLQEHSKPFDELAQQLCDTLPRNPERTTALRKLLEAKDCAVRARLFK